MQKPGHEALRYEWKAGTYVPENIIFCVDVDRETEMEMKSGGGKQQQGTAPAAPTFSRMDAVKQALLLFVHSKLTMNPHHQFAFITLDRAASWFQREYTNNVDLINSSIRNLSPQGSFQQFDISPLLLLGASEGRLVQSQGRILRLVLIYCRSSVVPEFQKHLMERQKFTLDALYMHDKPAPNNCPQKVYDALVDVLEHVSHHEGYIFESSSGSARTLFRHICFLLSHPQQRIVQEDLMSSVKDFAQMKPQADVVCNNTAPRPAEEGNNAAHTSGAGR
ncbi:hypothetical protein R1flu_011034 [Riccia fluitans]|uniref:BRISC and BRCA1-A complex member 1 n=1 Tax=Riccia fluitans TaxID=41844 RepID=A0ABD1Z9T0_9MARC